jgi:hypothetical protein
MNTRTRNDHALDRARAEFLADSLGAEEDLVARLMQRHDILLEALAEAVDLMGYQDAGLRLSPEAIRPVWDLARAAIAKATTEVQP